jgi:exodeoxyribonuclease III
MPANNSPARKSTPRGGRGGMKIATFSINNINSRLPNLLALLADTRPDVACLQELKCTDDEFPAAAVARAGYKAAWRGQKTWNGVAILSRPGEPILTATSLAGRQ